VQVISTSIKLSSQGEADMHDITDRAARAVSQSGLRDGIVTLFCPSATSGLTTIEYEEGALSDLKRLFDEIVPAGKTYLHNLKWHDGNGHSHVRAALLGPSLTVPFTNGRLTLGTWQQIVFIDFDNGPRRREIVVQIMGE
jgi:secondary thiamine-phosphate synthase enzyme